MLRSGVEIRLTDKPLLRALERVVRAQLDLTRRRTNAGNLTESGIARIIVGISVACDVEEIEEVSPEADRLPFQRDESL